MPEFEGHNRASLNDIYRLMAMKAMRKFGKKSTREVSVVEVEEWLNSSEAESMTEKQLERQQWIIEVNEKEKVKKWSSNRK